MCVVDVIQGRGSSSVSSSLVPPSSRGPDLTLLIPLLLTLSCGFRDVELERCDRRCVRVSCMWVMMSCVAVFIILSSYTNRY